MTATAWIVKMANSFKNTFHLYSFYKASMEWVLREENTGIINETPLKIHYYFAPRCWWISRISLHMFIDRLVCSMKRKRKI